MPIKFRCPSCNQLMGIARRKAGSVIGCPKCHHPAKVPYEDQLDRPDRAGSAPIFEASDFERLIAKVESNKPVRAADDAGGKRVPASASPLLRSVGGRQPEREAPVGGAMGVVEIDAALAAAARDRQEVGRGAIEDDSADIPIALDAGPTAWLRNPTVLLALLAVGLIVAAFGLGVIVGRYVVPLPASAVSPTAAAPNAVKPANPPPVPQVVGAPAAAPAPPAGPRSALAGEIRFRGDGGELPDVGSNIVVFAAKQQPSVKISVAGLPPGDASLVGPNQLRRFGGECVVVGGEGKFTLQVAEPGLYHVLLLSKSLKRNADQPIELYDQSILGQYFDDVPKLLNDRYYLLLTRELQIDKPAS
ncbi:MAG: hypothetical protein ACRDD1_18570, partial [Planctomycetia bacterium]